MASVSVAWQSGIVGLTLADGGVNSLSPRVWFKVTDTNLAGNGIQDTISVLVNSTSDQSGIMLKISEDPGDTGTFENTNLIFTNGPAQFQINSKFNAIINSPIDNIDPSIIDTIPNANAPDGFNVFSSSDATGIPLILTETGPNTGIFTSKLEFTSSPSVPNSSIQVKNGDIVSIVDLDTFNWQNMLIVPNPDPALGALPAVFTDNVTAIYNGVKDTAWINGGGGGGGGGGGFVRPGLVLDLIASTVGGSPYIVSPPSFGGRYYHYSDGLTLVQGTNKTIFDISQYNQEIPKQVMVSEDKVKMTFKTFESFNPEGMVHMGLYFIPRGDEDMITTNSIASIVYDKGSPVEVNDPSHILSNSSASSTSDGKFQYTQFSFIPTKSYDKMSFLVRAWNDHMYSTDARIYDAVDEPEPVKTTLPSGVVMYTDFNELEATLEKAGFYKPSIMSHIHGTDSVFNGNGAGTVYWLYDTINHIVTIVISDNNESELASAKAILEPYEVEKKGNYTFMSFTSDQINRWNQDQEQRLMGIEAAKAMFMAAEHGLLGHRNW